jgi:transcriptional regulator with XRE-family HTH domain
MDVLDAVGPRLRALRRQRGLTLSELAESTGISVSTLSRLESGSRRPTLELLLPLARAHQVSLDELVDAPPTGDPRVQLRPVQRFGATVIPLTRRPGGVQAWKMVYPPGWPHCEPEPQVHEGYEWLYVLAGRMRLHLGGRDTVLRPARWWSSTPACRTLRQPRPGAAEVLSLFGPQGERMHVRTRPVAVAAP